MAAPSYTTDLTDITTAETTTGWSALGGGASGLSVEPDFTIQGSNCIAKQIKAETKGHVFNSASLTIASSHHVFTWVYVSTPGTTDTHANGGIRITFGSSTSARSEHYVAGNDTYKKGGWVCYPVRHNLRGDVDVGSPDLSSVDYYGAVMKGTVTVKSPNLGIDAIRYGNILDIDAGEVSDKASLVDAATESELAANAWGIVQEIPGGVLIQCTTRVGFTTASNILDANISVIFPNSNPPAFARKTLIGMKGLWIYNTSTVARFSSVSFTSLDLSDRGFIQINEAGIDARFDICSFQSVAVIGLKSGTTMDGCTLTNCGEVNGETATISNNTFNEARGTVTILATGNGIATGIVQPRGLTFGDSGNVLVSCPDSSSVQQVFTVATAYDLGSTIALDYTFDTGAAFNQRDCQFNTDGTKIFILGSDDTIRQSDLSTAWDCQNASRTDTANTAVLTSQGTDMASFIFNDDGTAFFALDTTNAVIYEYSVATAFDFSSTITYQREFYVGNEDGLPIGISFNGDGTRLYMSGTSGNRTSEYIIFTPYSFVDRPVLAGSRADIGAIDANPHGTHMSPDGGSLFIAGRSNNDIYQAAVCYAALKVATLASVTNNLFNSSGTGHAIQLTGTGVMSWDNTDSGYAVTNGSTGDETILCTALTGTITLNVAAGATTPTIKTLGVTVTVQSADIVFSFTLDPSITGYEWRLYEKEAVDGTIGTVELDGEESALVDNQSYSYQYASDTEVVLQIIAAGYEESQTILTLGNADQDRTIILTKESNL